MGLFCLFPSFAIRSTIDCFSVAGDWTLGRFVSIPTMEARLSMKARQGPQLDRWARNLSSREGGRFPSRYSEESFRTSTQSGSPLLKSFATISKKNTSFSPGAILN